MIDTWDGDEKGFVSINGGKCWSKIEEQLNTDTNQCGNVQQKEEKHRV